MTVTAPAATPVLAFDEPDGIAPRGTVVVLAGRGETPAVYERFGTRIARDAYRVRVFGDATAAGAVDAARALLADRSLTAPVVLVGSDAGAAVALEIAATAEIDGVVIAGLPVRSGGAAVGDRTACPNHAGVLERETGSALTAVLPPELLAVAASAVRAPLLALHGDADPVSPVDEAVAVLRTAPHAEIHLVAGGRHDVLNDVSHRSVAATVVLFLERVKASPEGAPLVVRAWA